MTLFLTLSTNFLFKFPVKPKAGSKLSNVSSAQSRVIVVSSLFIALIKSYPLASQCLNIS